MSLANSVLKWPRAAHLWGGLAIILTACANPGSGSNTYYGRFSAYPTKLMDGIKSACADPAQTFNQISPRSVECRDFLGPDETAAAILQYNGTIDDLPQIIIRLTVAPQGQSFLLTIDTFLNVPQKSGEPARVLFPSAGLDRKVASLFKAAGGEPVSVTQN